MVVDGTGLYYFLEVWWHKMIAFKPPARWIKQIRRDRIVTLSFIALMALGFGVLGYARTHSIFGALWLVGRVEVIPFVGFCVMIGSVVHVHHVQPDIRWWKRGEWTKFKGQMEGTTVNRVPKGLNFFFHWIMIHTPHHVDMRIPMYNLERPPRRLKVRTPRSCTIRRGASRTFVTVRVRASCTTSSKGTGSPTRPHARPWPLKWREEPTLRISLYDSEPSIPMTSRPGGTQPRTGSRCASKYS